MKCQTGNKMKKDYQKWRVKILKVQKIYNLLQVTIRLSVRHPITGEWETQDGIGIYPLSFGVNATECLLMAKKAAIEDANNELFQSKA